MNQEKVNFGQMVTNLFKADSHSFNTDAAAIMHSAVGIMGEVIELVNSSDRDNVIEEAGDLEFYIESLLQSIKFDVTDMHTLDSKRAMVAAHEGPVYIPETLIASAAEILDYTKKAWVYHKPMEGGLRLAIAASLGTLCGALQRFYAEEGLNHADILAANQEKLAKRYPDGVYSNQHAQSRLDKQEG